MTDLAGKPVEILPDGTPSVQAIPRGPICFGEIPPCTDGEPSCVTREFIINTRGAKEGEYNLKFKNICYSVAFYYEEETCFKLKLCKS